MTCIGDHLDKSSSSPQSVIALSTGEAEPYALNNSAARSIGLQSLLADMSIDLQIWLHTDETTGRVIATRRRLGKVRHIAVNKRKSLKIRSAYTRVNTNTH